MILTPEEYARIRAQAIAEYPGECCGVVMDKPGERLLLACRNIQDELHVKDPERHPRDSRTAYYIDPKDLIAMGRREAQGFRVLTIYHSHIDAGAYFSARTSTTRSSTASRPIQRRPTSSSRCGTGRWTTRERSGGTPPTATSCPSEWKKPEGDFSA
jgi:proteasome lid subunit RPN8/RPN11